MYTCGTEREHYEHWRDFSMNQMKSLRGYCNVFRVGVKDRTEMGEDAWKADSLRLWWAGMWEM